MRCNMKRAMFIAIVFMCVLCLLAISLEPSIGGLHECHGDGCAICMLTTLCERLVCGLILLACMFGLLIFTSQVIRFVYTNRNISEASHNLVILKVKLSI